MDQYDDYPQKIDERQQLGRYFATPLTPTTDVSTPEEGQEFINEQEGLHSATWTRGSHTQDQPDIFRSPSYRPPRTSVLARERLHDSRNPTTANDRIEHSNQYVRLSPPSTAATQGAAPFSVNVDSIDSSSESLPRWSSYQGGKADLNDHEASLDQFKESRSARVMAETARHALYDHQSTQAPGRNASRSLSHYNALLAKPAATPRVIPR
ncbi:hypothetical protein JOM56_009168, partial [Amanita muscaria]